MLEKYKNIRSQSNEEWLRDYKGVKGSSVIINFQDKSVHSGKYIFHSFRTTCKSRLVISFINITSGETVDSFFNVDIKKQRGIGSHRTGQNCQFYPAQGSKFRKFWMLAVKKEPYRWSRVHKEMNSKLKRVQFSGDVKKKFRASGESYIQLNNIRILSTEKAQKRHEPVTGMAQAQCTGL